MKIHHEIAKEDFDKLLDWLSEDRDEAGVRFEQIRDGLMRYFRLKGCHEPELLADESMNRVIKRIDELDLKTGASPTSIFYGFANKVFLEYVRTAKKRTIQLTDASQRVISLEHPRTAPTVATFSRALAPSFVPGTHFFALFTKFSIFFEKSEKARKIPPAEVINP